MTDIIGIIVIDLYCEEFDVSLALLVVMPEAVLWVRFEEIDL